MVGVRSGADCIENLAIAHGDEVQAGNNQEDLMAGTRSPERILRQLGI
jgi:hypothetical protein